MFELTNEQRKCFGLLPVERNWTCIELKAKPYGQHTTISYLDGTTLRKFIETGDKIYTEYEICEQLSDDLKYLLPKTPNGKPVPLSATTLEKRKGFGMCLSYLQFSPDSSLLSLYNHTSQRVYYSTAYESLDINGIEDFRRWVEEWCGDTSEQDLEEITRFSTETRQHVKFREGDVFRFKINRRLYGYGRILLDYALMRKKKVPFWDVMLAKPLACSVYHIATERKDVSILELAQLKSLPSSHMMDNHLFYGSFDIIGNIPISETEDYPIIYGNSNDVRYRAVLLQCGKLYRREDNGTALYDKFKNMRIGFELDFQLSVLLECIEADSNDPYWSHDRRIYNCDLRNPKFHLELEQVCKQFDISPSQLIK